MGARALAGALLVWSAYRWTLALDDVPDGSAIRHPTLRRQPLVGRAFVLLGVFASGSAFLGGDERDTQLFGLGAAIATGAWLYARRTQRGHLGAAELLSYAGAMLFAGFVGIRWMLGASAGSWSVFALAALLWLGALFFRSLVPTRTLALARARRLALAALCTGTVLALAADTLQQVDAIHAWWAAPFALLAFAVGLRLDSVSRALFLPRAGARLRLFERARAVHSETSRGALEATLALLSDAADAGPGASVHVAPQQWDAGLFAYAGTMPFGIVGAGNLAHLEVRRPDVRPWLRRMRQEEACAWVRLGSEEFPLGHLCVPEAYAAGALCYEEVRALHELGQRMATLLRDATWEDDARARQNEAQGQHDQARQALQQERQLRASQARILPADLKILPPLGFYSASGRTLLDALAEHYAAPRPRTLVLPLGVAPHRLLAAAGPQWHIVDGRSFEEPDFVAAWQRRPEMSERLAVRNAQCLSAEQLGALGPLAPLYLLPPWAALAVPTENHLRLDDLQERPEDIEATVLDELVQAGWARFGTAVGAEAPLRAHWVELGHVHGEALLRLAIRSAVYRLGAARTLTLSDL